MATMSFTFGPSEFASEKSVTELEESESSSEEEVLSPKKVRVTVKAPDFSKDYYVNSLNKNDSAGVPMYKLVLAEKITASDKDILKALTSRLSSNDTAAQDLMRLVLGSITDKTLFSWLLARNFDFAQHLRSPVSVKSPHSLK